MAGVKISALPAIAAPALSDVFAVVQNGVTYKETVTQLQSLLTLNSVSSTAIQNQTYSYFPDTGVADAYVITPVPAIAATVAGQRFDVLISNTNTGASTINPNGLGTENIKLADGSDPLAGQLLAGMIASLEYDGTNYQLLNPNPTATGTGLLVRQTSPTINTPNIVGVTDGSSAAAGSVGELLSASLLNASAANITTSTVSQTILTLSLTAGDWEVWGNLFFNISATNNCTAIIAGIHTTTNVLPDLSLVAQQQSIGYVSNTAGINAPCRSFNVSSTTPIYLVANATFASGTVTASGSLHARRIR